MDRLTAVACHVTVSAVVISDPGFETEFEDGGYNGLSCDSSRG
jgi:hypothetical protein